MQIIPFRKTINREDNMVYTFEFKSDNGGGEYATTITIDELDDDLVISKVCDCKSFKMRKKPCKHLMGRFIKEKLVERGAIQYLKEFGINFREEKE